MQRGFMAHGLASSEIMTLNTQSNNGSLIRLRDGWSFLIQVNHDATTTATFVNYLL